LLLRHATSVHPASDNNCGPAAFGGRVGAAPLSAVCSGVIQPQPDAEIRTHFLIQPGWQNSGPHHWQTIWQAHLRKAATRVPQQDWLVPERTAWTRMLEKTIRRTPAPVVILAHSIGCMATIFAIQAAPVAAVVLVAPADAERSNAPAALHTFTPIPMEPLATPALLVASDSDPYCTLDRAEAFAQAWKADLEIVTGGGHMNSDAGFGPWPDGWLMVGAWLRRHGLGWPGGEGTHA
jgi:predicted alpha/beta hydrolase family esterase